MNTQTISRENLGEIAQIACEGWKKRIEVYAQRNPYGSDIEFTQSEVDEMFGAADVPQTQTLLKFFKKNQGIMERVNSFEDACSVLNIDPKSIKSAYERLKTIIKALNEGWIPDWKNRSQSKWYSYYEADGKGVPSFYVVSYLYSIWDFPSALYLKSQDLARHASKIADKEYKEYLMDI